MRPARASRGRSSPPPLPAPPLTLTGEVTALPGGAGSPAGPKGLPGKGTERVSWSGVARPKATWTHAGRGSDLRQLDPHSAMSPAPPRLPYSFRRPLGMAPKGEGSSTGHPTSTPAALAASRQEQVHHHGQVSTTRALGGTGACPALPPSRVGKGQGPGPTGPLPTSSLRAGPAPGKSSCWLPWLTRPPRQA